MGKIGIMGGTFDPIHNGHLLIGKQAYEEYGLDEIWFMPSGQPPHKKDHIVTEAKIRCEMTRLAIEDYPYFSFSDFEVSRQGNSYTADTLRLLRETYPKHIFYFIIGADSLYEIEKWYHPEKVLSQAIILAAGREYNCSDKTLEEQIIYLSQKYNSRIFRLHSAEIDISSMEIRLKAMKGYSLESYVPKKVWEYIKIHRLYQ